MNKQRLCGCHCVSCADRENHPVVNCRNVCDFSSWQITQDYVLDLKYQEKCACSCDYCVSGKAVIHHLKLDCVQMCLHEDERE